MHVTEVANGTVYEHCRIKERHTGNNRVRACASCVGGAYISGIHTYTLSMRDLRLQQTQKKPISRDSERLRSSKSTDHSSESSQRKMIMRSLCSQCATWTEYLGQAMEEASNLLRSRRRIGNKLRRHFPDRRYPERQSNTPQLRFPPIHSLARTRLTPQSRQLTIDLWLAHRPRSSGQPSHHGQHHEFQ